MATAAPERRRVNGKAMLSEAVQAGIAALHQVMEARLNQGLDEAVTHVLGRSHHERRSTGTYIHWSVGSPNAVGSIAAAARPRGARDT